METFEQVGNWYDEQCAKLEEHYQRRLVNACTAIEVVRVNDWYALQKEKIFNEWLRRMEVVAEVQ